MGKDLPDDWFRPAHETPDGEFDLPDDDRVGDPARSRADGGGDANRIGEASAVDGAEGAADASAASDGTAALESEHDGTGAHGTDTDGADPVGTDTDGGGRDVRPQGAAGAAAPRPGAPCRAAPSSPVSAPERRPTRLPTSLPPMGMDTTGTSMGVDTTGSLRAIREEPEQPWLWRHATLVTIITLVLALVVGLGLGQLVARPSPGTSSSPSATGSRASSGQPAPTASMPYTGPVRRIKATKVTSDCAAPGQLDLLADGRRTTVTPTPDAVNDAAPLTVWACRGPGVNRSLTFTVPANTTLVGVAVMTAAPQIAEGGRGPATPRVISRVNWSLADGQHFSQSLSVRPSQSDQLMIQPVTVNGPLTMTIAASTESPGAGSLWDGVLISGIALFTKA